MAQSGTSPTQLLAVTVIGFAAWQVFKSGSFKGFGSTPGPAAKAPNTAPTPVASGVTPGPVPLLPVVYTVSAQYNEQHSDGWYQVTQWDPDGHYDFTFIPPEKYAAYGIPVDPTVAATGLASNGSTSFTGGIPYPAQSFYAPGGGGQNAPITPVVNWMLGVWNSLTGKPQ